MHCSLQQALGRGGDGSSCENGQEKGKKNIFFISDVVMTWHKCNTPPIMELNLYVTGWNKFH